MAAEIGHILVVDDSKVNRIVISGLVQKQGHTFEMAENGQKAIEMLRQKPFDLVLLDMIMPEMDGFETLLAIKSDSHLRHIPVIMVSALEDMANVVKCIEKGAEDYLPKPPDEILFRARIGACLEKKRLRDAEIENQNRLKKLNETLEIRNHFIRETFGKYLSDEIVESILETPGGLKLGGESRVLTVMMADLRGFTSIGERLPPEEVVGIINTFLEVMTEIIFKYGGTIDEFIGDAILVIFGAPIQHGDEASRAVACALEMQLAMGTVNERNHQAGRPAVAMGIGLNTGQVVVGNIGSKKRVKYGVVGKNVNLTSRIESYTTGGQIFISESTMNSCNGTLRIDNFLEVHPKGLAQPITIFEVGGIRGTFNVSLPEKEPMPWLELPRPFGIGLSMISEKHTSNEVHQAEILRINDKSLEIRADLPIEVFANLKLALQDSRGKAIAKDLYAKVLKVVPGERPTFVANLTSIPPEAEEVLQELKNDARSTNTSE